MKEKFGKGYILEVKVNPGRESEMENFIRGTFSDKAVVTEKFSNRYVFSVPKDCIKSLSNVFAQLENGNVFDQVDEKNV